MKSKSKRMTKRKPKNQMTPAQLLKMAEQQIAFWKIVQAAAKAEIKAKDRAKGKRVMPYRSTRNGVTVASAKPIKRARDGLIHGERVKGLTPAQRKLIPKRKVVSHAKAKLPAKRTDKGGRSLRMGRTAAARR